MKRLYTLLMAACISQFSFAQFIDNFDSYTSGSYLAQSSSTWTTWNGATGGATDVKIVSNKSNSGSNSIYFSSSSATGGPQDIVLPFGGELTTGNFVFQQAMYVESNKGAYFNFQGEVLLGQIWSLNVFCVDDGKLYVTNGDNISMIETTYPTNQWFDLKIVANLNVNTWEVFVNNVSKGSFQNLDNVVASLDLYPVNAEFGGNNASGFWVDDCGFTHTPYKLPARNAGVSYIDLGNPVIVGVSKEPIIQVRNLGKTTITSFDISVTYNGNTETKSVSGLSLDSLETKNISLGKFFTITSASSSISATVSNVNGMGSDDEPGDDTKVVQFNSIIPTPGKLVIVEEATGTWCGWCPRGTVAMGFLARDYKGLAQGIAVHNNDPMTFDKYDQGIGLRISGYPSALVDRGLDTDPSGIWTEVGERLQETPKADMVAGANYNSSTGALDVSIKVDFTDNAAGDWRIACVLVEDSVFGTTSDYGQSNSYSNYQDLIGVDGVNWKTLPSTVPASQMVYDHVARVISPGFDGAANSFPTSITTGAQYIFNFNYVLSSNWKEGHMHIVGLLIDNSQRFDNGCTATIDEAVANGWEEGTVILKTEQLAVPDDFIKIYPNPSDLGYVDVLISSRRGENVTIEVIDQNGRLMMQQGLSSVSGPVQLRIPSNDLLQGFYFLKIITGEKVEIRKFIVK